MYKLVAIDLDGTMLNTYGEVTESTKRILKETMKKGCEVVIASGRTIDSIQAIADEIGTKKYMIAGNGSIVYDISKKNIIYEKYIPKSKALNIIKICEDNSITYSVYTNKTIIANSLKYNILYYYKQNLKKQPNKKTSITLVESIYDYVKNIEDEKVMKIFICDSTESIFNAILRKIGELEDIEILDVSHMSRKVISNGSEEVPIEYFYTEITEKNVDKWYALEFLINKLHIEKKEVMAIGDNVNDRKMIEQAGLGIAMKNSTPKITEVANYVTDFDNNNDGAARAIEKFL
ncbi:MAG: HAD family phosphatase [Clostridia bacterium]|nr:HAD family phosphatase [Clostridia bacterium]